MTKFFAKCLLNLEQISFNIDMKKAAATATKSKNSQNTHHGSSLVHTDSQTNFDTNDDENRDESEREDDDDDDDDDDGSGGLDSDDSLDDLIKSKLKLNLKKKMNDAALNGEVKKTKSDENKKDEVYGIPDGSDSEISDFDVDVDEGDNDDDDDDDEEDGEEEEEEEDDWVIMIFLFLKHSSSFSDIKKLLRIYFFEAK
jgi:hypothetical protein